MNKFKKLVVIALAAMLSATALCGCNKDNIDKFYDTGSSSDASSETTESDESKIDISKEYSLEIPDYSADIELGKYIGVEYYINEDYYVVTDDMVTNRMCQGVGLSPTDVTDRGAKYGDTVTISFVGKIDGKEFDGNTADKYEILLGEGRLSILFEEKVVGMKPGETKTIDFTFPAEYSDTTVAGKTAKFETTVNSIKSYKESDITESLLAEKTSFTKVEDYKASVKAELEDSVARTRKNDIATIILSKISETSTVKNYDETRINELIDAAKSATSKYAQNAGITAEEYVKKYYDVESYEEYEKSLKPTAEEYLKSIMIISAITYKENLNVTDEEYQEQIKKYLDTYHISQLDLSSYYTAEDIVYSLLVIKVQDFLVSKGKRLDSPPETTSADTSAGSTESTAESTTE